MLTPPAIDLDAFADLLAATLEAGDVAAVQLRLKPASPEAITKAAERLRPIVQDRGAAMIVNDHPEIAARTGCDGVHIGPEDMPYRDARRIVGPDAIVGISAKVSRHAAMVAAEDGATYVAFGAFFETTTKEVTAAADPEILEWWSAIMTVPCVAIGGITPDNCAPLVRAGADFICASSGIWNHPEGPAAAVKAYNAAIDRALG